MMKNTLVKVGIIGCGRIAGHHCRAIVATPGTKLVAVCDLSEEKAMAYGVEFGAKVYTNYHQMLQNHPDIDTVAVITPSGMHYEHALDIICRYRKNIIVEKPTFMRPSQVAEVYDRAASVGVSVFAIFQNRYNSAVRRVHSGINNGELGDIRSISVRVRWCRQQRYYDMSHWRGTFALDGGCLTNQGIHHVDLLRLMGGEVDRVCSIHRTLGSNIEVEDTATATLLFKSGALGTLEITTAARPTDYEASISFVCEKGLAQIGGIAVNQLQLYSPEPEACIKESEDFSGNVYGLGHFKIYQDIVVACRGEQPFPVTRTDTMATIQLLNAFYRSDENCGWVDVASVGESSRLGRFDDELASLYRTEVPLDVE